MVADHAQVGKGTSGHVRGSSAEQRCVVEVTAEGVSHFAGPVAYDSVDVATDLKGVLDERQGGTLLPGQQLQGYAFGLDVGHLVGKVAGLVGRTVITQLGVNGITLVVPELFGEISVCEGDDGHLRFEGGTIIFEDFL